LALSSTLKTEATCSSRTSNDFQWTTWCYIPEDGTLQNHLFEKLKSYNTTGRLKWKNKKIKKKDSRYNNFQN
jgi:hypothetical protein